MASDWREVSLGDVAGFITGYPFKSQYYTDNADAPRLIGGDNISQGNLRWDNTRRWPLDMTNGLDDYWLEPGDVVLAMDRPWIEAGLKRAAVGEQDVPSLLVQRTARLRGTNELDTAFLRYVVSSQAFAQYILSVQTGTAIPHISPTQIRAFSFRLPPIEDQRAIAHILGSLDDKIELNRKQSETLEAMARALFKSWFVDFEPVRAKLEGRWQRDQSLPGLPAHFYDLFPDSMKESELGEIPEGWEMRSLDSIANYLNGLALQKFPPESDDEFLPVIKIAQLRAGNANGADRASARIKPEYVIVDGDVLFSWSGSLEVEVWNGGRGALNQHLFKVMSDAVPKWFYFFATRHHLQNFRAIAADKATTMGHIQRKHLTDARIAVAPPEGMKAFDSAIAPLFDQLVSNAQQSRSLAQLRDTLLPKLISGELRVPDAGRIVGGAL